MRLSELQDKDVVNVNDGKKIGNIIDIIIGGDGTMNGLVIEKSKFLVSLFTARDEIEISWKQIEKIGEDVILVKVSF